MRLLYACELPDVMDLRFLRSLAAHPEVEVALASFEWRAAPVEDPRAIAGLRVFALPSYPPGFAFAPGAGLAARLRNRRAVARARRRMVRGLRGAIAEFRPDVLAGTIVQNAAWAAWRTGFHPFLCMPWGSDVIVIPWQSPALMREALAVLRGADAIVTDSGYARRAVGRLDPALLEKTSEGPYGIDPARMRATDAARAGRAALGWTDHEVLICPRGVRPVYGPDVIARAVARLARERPRLRAAFVGHWEEPAGRELRALFGALGIEGIVRCLDRVPNERMADLLALGDVYVQANRSDGCPATLLEAMACERVVASTDLPTYHDMTTPDCGITMTPVDDDAALAGAIAGWLDRPAAERAARGRVNRAHVCARYDWDRNFPIFVEQLRDTVRRARSEPPRLDPERSPWEWAGGE